MLGGADNPNGELPSYITGADITSETKNHGNTSPLQEACSRQGNE